MIREPAVQFETLDGQLGRDLIQPHPHRQHVPCLLLRRQGAHDRALTGNRVHRMADILGGVKDAFATSVDGPIRPSSLVA